MLQQILADMYVDPELLAELSEEQKQILFLKMRQEQVRRWKEREAVAHETSVKKATPGKAHGKTVRWKLGADNEVWVWVMGEHVLDKPYDVLCEEILAQRAQQQETTGPRGSETSLKPSVPWSQGSQPAALQGAAARKEEEKAGKKAKEEGISAAERAGSGDHAQAALATGRDVRQLLADAKAQTRRSGSQQGTMDLGQRRPEGPGTSTEKALNLNANQEEARVQKLDKDDPEWQESLRKSKAADERRRSLAKQARDDYRRLSLQGIRRGKVVEVSKNFGGQGPSLLPRPPLPPKPKNPSTGLVNGKPNRNPGVQRTTSTSTQESIVRWFKEEQFPLRAGYEKSTDTIARWFHGILTRSQAEALLSRSVPGSFLVRISDKIKGYALSYLSPTGCEHFLIDASSNSYSFLGVDQLQHATLADLVDYHKEEPITSVGKELLLYPCGQQGPEPDYLDLFE